MKYDKNITLVEGRCAGSSSRQMDGGGNMLLRSGLANTLADLSKLQVSVPGEQTRLA